MGGDGDDRLMGNGGFDTLAGGSGMDRFGDPASEIDELFTFWADWIDAA